MSIDLKLLKKGQFEQDDDYVMYILINEDYNSMHDLISQSCESIIKVIRIHEKKYDYTENYYNWLKDETKIFLKASQEELLYAINNYSDICNPVWCQHVIDLNDQNSPFIITSVAFSPIMRDKTPEFIYKLKKL